MDRDNFPLYIACSTHLTSNSDFVADMQLGEYRNYLITQNTQMQGDQYAYIVAMGDFNLNNKV